MKNLAKILFLQILMSLNCFHYVQLHQDLVIFFQSLLLASMAGFWPAVWVALDSSATPFLLLMLSLSLSLSPFLLFPLFPHLSSSSFSSALPSARNTFSVGGLLMHSLLCILPLTCVDKRYTRRMMSPFGYLDLRVKFACAVPYTSQLAHCPLQG